ncbi:hypothetical protein BOX15_Mlig014077g1, partial [Macrostomum lignano]
QTASYTESGSLNRQQPEHMASEAEIADLRCWAESQDTLKGLSLPDEVLAKFLEVATADDSRVEAARRRLADFCRVRASKTKGAADWFEYPDVSSEPVQELLSVGYVVQLGYDDNGAAVVLFRSGLWQPDRVSFEDMSRYMNMCYDVLCADPATRTAGLVTMVDFQGFEMRHLTHWSLDSTKKLSAIQEAYPVKLKHVNYFNTSTVFNALYELLKMFMSKSVKELVRVHKSSKESLQSEIPARILPAEYGGTGADIKQLAEQWRSKIELQLPSEAAKYAGVVYNDAKK